jgi:hypothetical protein
MYARGGMVKRERPMRIFPSGILSNYIGYMSRQTKSGAESTR